MEPENPASSPLPATPDPATAPDGAGDSVTQPVASSAPADGGIIAPTGSGGFRSLGQVVGGPSPQAAAPVSNSDRVTVGAPRKRPSFTQQLALRQKARLIAGGAVALLVLAVVAGVTWYLTAHSKQTALQNDHTYNVTSIPLNQLSQKEANSLTQASQLSVNGQLRINNSFVLTPTATPSNPLLGQFYLNNQNNGIYYYDGTQFVQLANNSDLANVVSTVNNSVNGLGSVSKTTPGTGLTIQGSQLINTGVTGLHGTANQVSVSAASGDITLSLPQDIALGSTPSFAGITVGSLTARSSDSGLNVGDSTHDLTLQGANTTITSSANGFTTHLTFANPSSDNTLIVPDIGGTVCTTAGNCGGGASVKLQPTSPGTPDTGNLNISGTAIAGFFKGDGSQLTNVNAVTLNGQLGSFYQNASNINNGTLADAQLSSNVTLKGNTFNGANDLVLLDGTGVLPVLSAVNLTNINATNIASGTVNDSRLSGNVTLQGNTFNTAGKLVQLDGSDALPAVDGSALLSLNASHITSGILAIARGGTGAGDAPTARSNLGAAASGTNSDITSLTGVTSIAPAATLTIGSSGQSLILQGSITSLHDLNGTNQTTLSFTTPTQTNNNITIPDASGMICLDSGNCQASQFGGATTSLDNLASVALNASLLPATDGSVDLGSPSKGFGHLYVADSSNTFTYNFAGGALTANKTINLPNFSPSSATLCLDTGNCAGSGSSVTAGANTTGTIPVFTGSQQIGNSIITQDGLATTITIGGALHVTGAETIDGQLNAKGGIVTNNTNIDAGTGTIAGNGSLLTNLNAGNITSGLLDNSHLNTTVTIQGNAFNGNNELVQLDGSGKLPAVDGTALTGLNASNLTSGTVPDGRLSSNVPLKSGANVFTNTDTFQSNNAAGFRIQNAGGGTTLFNADTTGSGALTFGVGATFNVLASAGSSSTALCLNNTNQLATCNGNANTVTLQQAYNASTSPQITLNSTGGGLLVRDNATPLGGNLFAVQNSGGGTSYLAVTATGTSITGTLAVTSTINNAAISGGTLSGGNVSGGTLTSTAVNTLNVSGTAIAGTGSLTVDGNGSGTVSIGGISTGDVLLAGGSGANGCTVANSSGNLTCTGNITGAATGTIGYFTRSGTTLQPSTAGDNIQTTSSGTITSAGLLTSAGGLTVSGAATSINASSNFTTSINTGTSTGAVSIGNSLAGAVTIASGAASSFTTQAGNLTLQAGSGTVSLGTSTALTANGALSVTTGGTGALGLATAATGTSSTNSGAVTLQSGNATGTTSNSGGITIDSGTATGTTGAINIGTTNSHTIALGNSNAATTITQTAGTSSSQLTGTALTNTVGNTTQTISTNGVTIANSAGSINALQVQNASSTNVLTVDTLNSLANIGSFTGTGFTTPTTLGSSTTTNRQHVVADFNGDGKPDMATLTPSVNANVINVYMNVSGTLTLEQTFTGSGSLLGLAAGDINGDGKADLVTSSNVSGSSNNGFIYYGNATGGTWGLGGIDTTPDKTLNTGSSASMQAAATGDFNGDGKTDVVLGSNANSKLYVWMNNSGTIDTSLDQTLTINSLNDMTTGDFDANGSDDIAVTMGNSKIDVFKSTKTGVYTSTPFSSTSGTLSPNYTVTTSTNPAAPAVADFNGDGKADLAIISNLANVATVQVYIQSAGTLTIGYNMTISGSICTGAAAADFNGDGRSDLAASCALSSNNSDYIAFYLNAGGTLPSTPVSTVYATANGATTTGDAPTGLVPGDFNSDGRPDLVWGGDNSGASTGWTQVLMNTGTPARLGVTTTTSTSIGGIFQGVSGQSADLLEFQNTGGTILSEITAAGALQGGNGTGTNASGTALTLAGGQGTGTAAGGSINFQFAPAGSAGATPNGLVTGATLNTTGTANSYVTTFATPGQTTASTNSATLALQSGNATGTTSNSGNVTIDVGTATGTLGTITVGGTNARSETIGNSNSTNQVNLQGGGTTETIANAGDTVKSTSTTAFVVQTAGGTPLLTADTTGMTVTVSALTVSGNLTLGGHLITTGTVPTKTKLGALGSTGTCSVAGTDTAGEITMVASGTGLPDNGDMCTITFHTAFTGSNPRVIIGPADSNGASIDPYAKSISTAGFTVGAVASSITSGQTYTLDYIVAQ